MEFGAFILAPQRGYHQTSQPVMQNLRARAVAAGPAGVTLAWCAELHTNDPSSTAQGTAAKTRPIPLDTACILPLHHCARSRPKTPCRPASTRAAIT